MSADTVLAGALHLAAVLIAFGLIALLCGVLESCDRALDRWQNWRDIVRRGDQS